MDKNVKFWIWAPQASTITWAPVSRIKKQSGLQRRAQPTNKCCSVKRNTCICSLQSVHRLLGDHKGGGAWTNLVWNSHLIDRLCAGSESFLPQGWSITFRQKGIPHSVPGGFLADLHDSDEGSSPGLGGKVRQILTVHQSFRNWDSYIFNLKNFIFDYRILDSWPVIEPLSPAMEAWSLNHWIIGEVSKFIFKKENGKLWSIGQLLGFIKFYWKQHQD